MAGKPKSKEPKGEDPRPAGEPHPLTHRQRRFVKYYLGEARGNASSAARRAGYTGDPNTVGPRLLANVGISAAIAADLNALTLTGDEILSRLADVAEADIDDFITLPKAGGWKIDLAKARRLGRTHLIRKLKSGKYGPELELHSSVGALELLGKYRGLWKDQAGDGRDDPGTPPRIVPADVDDRKSRAARGPDAGGPGGDGGGPPGPGDPGGGVA